MPKFIRKPENVECMEFEDVRFETTVTGKPIPEVMWCCGDKQVLPSERVLYEVLEQNLGGPGSRRKYKDFNFAAFTSWALEWALQEMGEDIQVN